MEKNGTNLNLSVVSAEDISFFSRSTEEESADAALRDLKIAEGRGFSYL